MSSAPPSDSDHPPAPSRAAWGVATLLILVLVAGVSLGLRPAAAEVVRSDAIVHIDLHGLRYTYQPVTGDAALFDLRTDPDCLENLAQKRPDDAARLRRRLVAELGLESLEELREPHAETIERLRSLGYL